MSQENQVKLKLTGLIPYGDADDVRRIFEKPMTGAVASAAATTTQVEKSIGCAKRPCRLTACDVVGDTAVASDATSYATYNVYKRTVTDPTTAVTMLTISTTTAGLGAIVAWASKSLMGGVSSTAANFELDTGDVVTFAVAKAAGGVALGTQNLYLDFEELSD